MMDYLRYWLNPVLVLTAIAGFVAGGQWVWAGAATFVVLLVLDVVLPTDYANRDVRKPWLADIPVYLHVPLMIALYAAFAWRMRAGLGAEGTAYWVALAGAFASLLWMNVVPNLPMAHELMHRRAFLPRLLGKVACAFFFDPNRDVGHVHTHHLYFDTPKDSDTPRRSVWGPASWIFWGIVMLAAIPLGVGLYGGWLAGAVALAAIAIAKPTLEALNYLQHYGLVRDTDGPIENHHTWHHLSPMTRIAGLEITNHIDHHRDGYLPYYRLRVHPGVPEMPSVFLCALAALIPPVWERFIAQPRLKQWDLTMASAKERELAREANRRAGWPDWFDEQPHDAQAQAA